MKPTLTTNDKINLWLALITLIAGAIILVATCRVLTPFFNYLIWGIEY